MNGHSQDRRACLRDMGAIILREKIARGRITARLANVPRCLIGIEAGMATHYVARELSALGHDVKQVPPAYAKPFRQGHKNDFRDAYAIGRVTAVHPLRSRRPTISSIYKHCTGCDLPGRPTDGCDQSAPRLSWSTALRYVRGFVPPPTASGHPG